jgi:hypothetical protein
MGCESEPADANSGGCGPIAASKTCGLKIRDTTANICATGYGMDLAKGGGPRTMKHLSVKRIQKHGQ